MEILKGAFDKAASKHVFGKAHVITGYRSQSARRKGLLPPITAEVSGDNLDPLLAIY